MRRAVQLDVLVFHLLITLALSPIVLLPTLSVVNLIFHRLPMTMSFQVDIQLGRDVRVMREGEN